MKLNFPTNQSVLVLASYRTGSTALCDFISRKYNFVNFDEAFHTAGNGGITNEFNKFRSNFSNKFVVKVMPDHLMKYPADVNNVSLNSTVIRLTRSDVVKQIASFYTSSTRNIWHQTNDSNEPYEVPIDIDHLKRSISYILECNQIINNLDYRFDFDLKYEDLKTLDTQYKIYQKPNNYLKLLKTIKKNL